VLLCAPPDTSAEGRAKIYGPPTWFPQAPTLANFPAAWNSAPFGRFYVNSLITTLGGMGPEVLFAITSAYALAFLRFPRKDLVFLLLLAALMVPV
jgi:sn-glycerol 3-phosphate transport system permease protein